MCPLNVLSAVSAGCRTKPAYRTFVAFFVTVGVHDADVILECAKKCRRIIAVGALKRFRSVDSHRVAIKILLGDEELAALWTGDVSDVVVFLDVIFQTAFPACREVTLVTLHDYELLFLEARLNFMSTEKVV